MLISEALSKRSTISAQFDAGKLYTWESYSRNSFGDSSTRDLVWLEERQETPNGHKMKVRRVVRISPDQSQLDVLSTPVFLEQIHGEWYLIRDQQRYPGHHLYPAENLQGNVFISSGRVLEMNGLTTDQPASEVSEPAWAAYRDKPSEIRERLSPTRMEV